MRKIILTDKQIKDIIKQYTSFKFNMAEIGNNFSVSRTVIKNILLENNVNIKSTGRYPKPNKINIQDLSNLTLEKIRELSFKPTIFKNIDELDDTTYKINFLTKEYLTEILNDKGKDYVMGYLDDVLRFIRLISPVLPKTYTNESLSKLTDYVDNVNPIDEDGNIVNNKVNAYGNSFLKSNFNSYWESSYKGRKSPKDAWNDDKIMKKVLKYRLGINNSYEVFDISIYQIIRGISANRLNISFFKPLLASFIYKKYLGNTKNPVVFDPCSGFGGRLSGFKTVYPKGVYIGCEPNKQTYQELLKLNEFYDGFIIHNSRFEDLVTDFPYNLAFTSIPYFDLEIYSEVMDYENFDDWRIKFINPLLELNNLILNMSSKLCEELNLTQYIDCRLINSKNHFKKIDNSEVILKF